MPIAKPFNRMLLFALAPFIGISLWLTLSTVTLTLATSDTSRTLPEVERSASGGVPWTEVAVTTLEQAVDTAAYTGTTLQRQIELYNQTNQTMSSLLKTAAAQVDRPLQVYDRIITNRLGKPTAVVESDKLRAQLFYLQQEQFKSYAVKIKLKTDDAAKLVSGGAEPGQSQTTLQAVKAYQASVGINAGGFADSGGKRYPLGTTIIDGEYVSGFEPSRLDLFFVGLDASNRLIGGIFHEREQLDKLQPKFGATFVPVLLQSGHAEAIPDKWKTSPARAPRTVIANYKDDQLLLLVADGYSTGGSAGATLEELQSLLKNYGAVDAYNLDGGGSSSLVFNGNVINQPSDGSLRALPTHLLFFK